VSRAPSLSAAERASVRDLVYDDLSRVGDLWLAIQSQDYGTAARLGNRFVDQLLLMSALGWDPNSEPQKGAELPLPTDDLVRIFSRLEEEACGLLKSEQREAQQGEEERRFFRERAKRAKSAATRILGELD
jgi:hypothetical protein